MAVATAPTAVENGLTPAEKRHLTALERRISQGLQTFREVGAALLEIRDSRLYRDAFDTFEDYCRDTWQLNKVQAYQFIGAAQVVKALGNPEELANEAQARELVPLMRDDPEQMRLVWSRVKATTEPVTAALIKRVVREVTEPAAPPAPSETERLLAQLTRTIELMRRWKAGHHTRKDTAIVKATFEKLTETFAG